MLLNKLNAHVLFIIIKWKCLSIEAERQYDDDDNDDFQFSLLCVCVCATIERLLLAVNKNASSIEIISGTIQVEENEK